MNLTRDIVSSFNSGLRINVSQRIKNARLPTMPTTSDVLKAREHLLRAKADIDGLLVYLS